MFPGPAADRKFRHKSTTLKSFSKNTLESFSGFLHSPPDSTHGQIPSLYRHARLARSGHEQYAIGRVQAPVAPRIWKPSQINIEPVGAVGLDYGDDTEPHHCSSSGLLRDLASCALISRSLASPMDEGGRDAIAQLVRRTGIDYVVLLGDGHVSQLPTTYYIAPDGNVRAFVEGVISKAEVEPAIKKVLESSVLN